MRAQVDAPVELVIAIIILVMSMGLAFHVMRTTETNQCLAALKTQTQQLQEAILDVGLGSVGTKKTVKFSMPRCGDKLVEGLQFVRFSSAELCKKCPGHYNGCWQISPVAKTADGLVRVNDAITCIELPAERVSIVQDVSRESGCVELSTTPCPDKSTRCLETLGIGPNIYSPGSTTSSQWTTLGSEASKNYLITFNKVLSVESSGGHTDILVCAKPLGR